MKNVMDWRTTLIGLVIIGGGLASVFMGKADWTGENERFPHAWVWWSSLFDFYYVVFLFAV